jgi:hypothetical protein
MRNCVRVGATWGLESLDSLLLMESDGQAGGRWTTRITPELLQLQLSVTVTRHIVTLT